jgi:hypothetical protein
MSAYGRISILALQGRRVGLPGGCARAVDMSCSIRAGAGLAAFLLQGLSEEQLSGTSLRICADFGHAVSLCRMIASLRFSGGAFDVIGTTTWWQSGHWVKASSSPGVHFPVCSKWVPYPAKWPFLKRIMRAAQADVHMVEVPLWPVRAALCMKELRRSFRMLASCMGGPLSWRG